MVGISFGRRNPVKPRRNPVKLRRLVAPFTIGFFLVPYAKREKQKPVAKPNKPDELENVEKGG